MITYNGNEMMLQNDMGNTLILDSATGNIMGLNPGFIPIGMKEHGGIMYITSVDKEGNGEIGTIPSPIIRDFYKDKVTFEVNQSIPINIGDAIKISNKLYPADKFIANLQMNIDETNLKGQIFKKDSGLSPSPNNDPSDIILGRDVIKYIRGARKNTIYTPVLSYNSNIKKIQLLGSKTVSLFSSKGIYSLELYSRHDNSSDIPANSLSSPLLYQYGNEFVESNYWYLHTEFPNSVFPKDLLTATLNQNLKQFPSNSKPGYLAVKLLTEGINKFDILPRAKDPFYTPITYKSTHSSIAQYYTYFPGFYYSTDSGIYIDRIEARVIDENTAKEMKLVYPYSTTIPQFTVDILKTSNNLVSSFLDNPSKLDELFKNNNETNHMYNADENTLPQVQSLSDDSLFILTTLKQIRDHSTTDMESSTEGENKTYGGIFCVPLGEKYNNWYRAEIDYYDLYNNKQGTFTKRFNPYLNDVFGTNLHVDDIEYLGVLIMGKEAKYDLHTEVVNGSSINLYKPEYGYIAYRNPIGTSAPDIDMNNNIEYSGTIPFLNKINASSNSDLTTLYANYNTETQSFDIPLEVLDRFTLLQSSSSSYIYSKDNINLISNFTSTITQDSAKATFFRTRDIDVDKIWILNTGSPYYKNVLGWKTLYAEAVTIADYPESTDTSGYIKGKTYTLSEKVIFADIDTTNHLFFPNFNNTSINTLEYSPLLQIIKNSIDGGILLQTDFNMPYVKVRFNVLKDASDDTILNNCGRARIAYVTDNIDYNSLWGMRVEVPFLITTKYDALSIKLKYLIIPYFLLKGSDDYGNPINVYRFDKQNDTNITYQHNFELDIDGNPRNYILNEGDQILSKLNQCSYTHNTPFKYYNTKLQYDQVLSPGIYVLNILRVPGNGANNPESFLNLSIQVDSITKSFSKSLLLITPLYTNSITNTITSSLRFLTIYQPVVICLNTSSVVKITTDKGFERLNIGLYKIKDINKDEMTKFYQLADFYDLAMTYSDYMSNLAQTTESIYKGDKILQYNFIQKYGVFFKEAYVFIDGLIDENNIIRGVIIGDDQYYSYPFIPFDPSILPVSLSKYGDFIWNAYVMPESVLNITNNEYPDFVFSNPIKDWTFSTKPLPGNLRQLVEQLN